MKSKGPGSRKGSLNFTFKTLIAFALIERNEIREASSASTRSARSVDMAHDHLDILRIHGIVQAFFVDILNEKHEVGFWLERAVCVFCGAFDASIHRVEKDPQTGIPEDYRRLLIHGQRLLSHLDRFGKRSPELQPAREELEARLGSIQNRIDQLTKRVSEAASQGSGDVILSVFERTNSLSDSETSPSSHSMYEYSIDEATETLESPSVVYSPTEHGPYHWHIPVDYPQGAMGWETSKTVTPQLAATEVFDSMSMPDDDEMTRRVFGPNHRTIRKHAARRYRDHAGAWRASSQILSDPRVTISRETARGFIHHPTAQVQSPLFSSNDSGPSVQSEAELSLSHINKGSLGLASGVMSLIYPDSPPSRPRLIAGKTSYAHARAERASDDDVAVTPTFSYPPPTFRDTATTILKRKETDRPVSLDGLVPVKISSPLAASPIDPEEIPAFPDPDPAPAVSEDNLVASMHSSMLSPDSPSQPRSGSPSRPSATPLQRSTKSSPSQRTGPFPPPPPIAIEVNTTSSLRANPTANSPIINPNRISTHSLGEYGDYTSKPSSPIASNNTLPYPQAISIVPDFYSMPEPPAPWVPSLPPNLHPQGYSSQPMSRDPSHQSNSSLGSRRSLGLARDGSPNSSNQGLSSSPASQIMQRPRARRPSLVETEPSPRLDPLELDPIVTSYQLYRDAQEPTSPVSRSIFRGRRRGGSTPGPAVPRISTSGPKFLSRFKSLRTRSEGRRQIRRGSDGAVLGSSTISESELYRPTTEMPPPRQTKIGEEMTRSGSAGIRLDKDTVVEFGSPPSQAAAAIAEARRRSPRMGGGSPLAGQPFSPPRKNSTSPPSVRGSPPRGIGLGIH